MKLNAKVIETISSSGYADKRQRVKLKVADAESWYSEIIAVNADSLALDDEVVLLTLRQDEAADIIKAIDELNYPVGASYTLAILAVTW